MTDYKKYINALRKCAKEHENDRTSFGHIIVSDLCRDTANLLESLEQEPCDCISRADVRRILNHEVKFHNVNTWKTLYEKIDNLPSVQPKTDVLDKIRAEIKEESRFCPLTEGLERALEIIDKYTAEKERG